MLSNLGKIAKIESLLAKFNHVEINANLPLEIKVAKKLSPLRYQLEIGSRTLDTRSHKELDIGAKYWGEVSTGKGGVINLNKLKQKPAFLDPKFPFKLDVEDTLRMLANKEGVKTLKETFLKLASTSEKAEEFTFYTQLALHLDEGKITLPFVYENKPFFVQLQEEKKPHENEELMESSVKFYATFNNLGPINGYISLHDEQRHLELYTMYESTQRLLSSYIEELNFSGHVSLRENIEPLYTLNEKQLLDVSV